MLNLHQFIQFANNDELYELSSLIRREHFDIEGLLPEMIELLKEVGYGNLYGLSPTFTSNVLYYNVDLFNEYGIEFPYDGMTWDELFQIAQAFSRNTANEDQEIYGLYFPSYPYGYFHFINSVCATDRVTFFDPNLKNIIFNTPEWKRCAEIVIDAIQSGAILFPDQLSETITNQAFITRQAAMTISGPILMNYFMQAPNFIKDFQPFEWNMVTVPTSRSNQSKSKEFNLDYIFTINAISDKIDVAWELIKYVNSEEYAKTQSADALGLLSTRVQFNSNMDNHNTSTFYELKPDENYFLTYAQVPEHFMNSFAHLEHNMIKDVIENKISLDEAIYRIEIEGQILYDDINEQIKERFSK